MIADVLKTRNTAEWVEGMQSIDVPCGPVQTMDQVFATPQIQARGMEIEMAHPLSPSPAKLMGSPLKLSETPVDYKLPPPPCGFHTDEVLKGILKLGASEIETLKRTGVVQ